MKRIYRALLFLIKHGILNLMLDLKNQKLFDVKVSSVPNLGNTSLTDSQRNYTYPDFCELASSDDKLFSEFRRAKIIATVYDHVSLDLGKSYIAELLKHGKVSKKFVAVAHQIDTLGNPRQYNFAFFGKISPTTLRYLKVYLDLKHYFGNLEKMKVTEIGIGFGGQASLIALLDPPVVYNLFDIPPVLNLAKRFTGELDLQNTLEFLDGRNPKIVDSDLVISNYAFSELTKTIQEIYLENVILRATRGYITWNSLGEDFMSAYSLADLVRIIPNSQIIPEVPYSHAGNSILIWGHNQRK
jgi:hypothetical protein